MLKKNDRILAIDPGAREMGVVVLEDTDLIHYKVINLKRFRPEKNLKKAAKEKLTKLIAEYNIKFLVVEDGWFSQEVSPLFQSVMEAIEEIAKGKKLKLVTFAPKTIRKAVCGDGKATKKRTARVLADRYPELEIYLEQNYRWKEKYWGHAFDALATGITFLMQPSKYQK